MAEVIKTTIQFRRGLAETWKKNNPVLAYGEPAFEKDTYRLKIGNGVTAWNDLDYFGGTGVLRRDNDYNYKADYVPLKGEVLLVDVAGQGLKCKVGDGITAFAALPYEFEGGGASDLVAAGYYKDGKLYTDNTYTVEITPTVGVIYIDQTTSRIFTTDGTDFGGIEDSLPTASATVAGLVKLYDTTGNNTDGSMTQKAITEAVNTRVKATVDGSMLILEMN